MDELLLTKLINEGKSIRDISKEIGKSDGSVKHWLKKYNLKTKNKAGERNKKYSKDEISLIVERCKNYSEVVRELGYKVCGGRINWIKKHILQYGISIQHFESTQERMKRIGKCANTKTKQEMYSSEKLTSEWGRICASTLRSYLIFNKVPEKCNNCKNSIWMGRPLRLDIDHINNDPHDNRLVNIQFLCPNCHRQKTIPIK